MFLWIKEIKQFIIRVDKCSSNFGFCVTSVTQSGLMLDKQKCPCFFIKRVRQSLSGQFLTPPSELKGLGKPY